MRVLSKDIVDYAGQQVSVAGWVHRIRELGAISFVLLRDRTGIIQLVCTEKPALTLESVVRVDGAVKQNPKACGGYEVQVATIVVLSAAATPLPYHPNDTKGGAGVDVLLDNRTLSLRTPRISGVFRVQSAILAHFARYMRTQDFTEIKSSKLVATGTEGGTGLFEVRYFNRALFLAQSPQFYKQALVASGMERVFEIGAAYRAEKHETARHLNEYVSLDVEMGFIDDENTLMDLEIEILCAVCRGVHDDCADVIAEYGFPVPTPETIMNAPRISYKEALRIIAAGGNAAAAQGGTVTVRGNTRVFEINPEGERILSAWAQEEHGSDLVFVCGFPLRKRPFYTYPDGNATKSFDCIFRGVEITTGGLRIHQYEQLHEHVRRFNLKPEDLTHYLDIFKYGCPPHGGFAIGLERLTQKFCGLNSVKEASLFPRDRSRFTP